MVTVHRRKSSSMLEKELEEANNKGAEEGGIYSPRNI